MKIKQSGFRTRSVTDRPVQSQKQARGLKFWITIEDEGLYCLYSENKRTELCSVSCCGIVYVSPVNYSDSVSLIAVL